MPTSQKIKRILILNGPNLNMLGQREADIYGHVTLKEIEEKSRQLSEELRLELDFIQSNSESEIIEQIQKSQGNYGALIINGAAYTHTSVAIMDALLTVKIPVIEIHLSNIFKREQFRHNSYISLAAQGIICGFGVDSYLLSIRAVAMLLA